ncbi:MAG: CheR family methyltransferase [Sphingomonas oligoaromativorans]
MEISDGSVRILAALLEARTGQQLAHARHWRIEAALRPLMAELQAVSMDALISKIVSGENARLSDRAIDALLNHETFFFRDIASFRLLDTQGLERIRVAREATRRLRIWSAGCSTGQEVYTLAMLIADQRERWRGWSIDIVGTDLSAQAIERAREGRYSQFEIQRGLPVVQMLRRFDQIEREWQVSDDLRAMVSFRTHNLLSSPPPGMFDVVLCRNVLLYFSAEVRGLVFGRIASAMPEDGVLMLGAGETVMGHTDHFVSDYECRGLYRKRIHAPSRPPVECAAR